MIERSFIILDRISLKKEKSLWKQGIHNWGDFLQADAVQGISSYAKSFYDRKLRDAQYHLRNGDSSYFSAKLPLSQAWRLYPHFREEAVFLDIETTGVSRRDSLTVIGLFDGYETKSMIRRINLNIPYLKKELSRYKLLVTFNGGSFDLPFLEKRYPGVIPKIPHFDLRTGCRMAGLNGGLKKIERELGLQRRKPVEEMRGGDAVTLWRMFTATGDDYYLKLLVEYNEEDVINLKKIANVVCERLNAGLSP